MNDAYRLFIVEDDDDVAFLMRKSLERAGHQVQVCHNGADALLVLRNQSFHLVLLDQNLPDMPGLDVLKAIVKDGIQVPVLMVTGVGDEGLATKVLHAGAVDYIAKDRPLTFLSDLSKRVAEAVTRHRLLQSNRLLVDALDSAQDGVLITDRDGVIQHVNDALIKLFGYNRDEMLGQTPRIFKSHVQPPAFYQEMWRTILDKRNWQGELVNRRKDGNVVDASLSITPLIDSQDEPAHFVAIFRDVTERKQMERQLLQAQKMQSVGTLAGGVAHEFNNLLAGIQGYAALGLREKNLSPTIKEFLDNVVNLSERAAHLTRQLLAYARKPSLSRKATAIAPMLQAISKLIRYSLNVPLELETPADAEGLIAQADENQLQQVLVNLCLNARDAMPPSSTLPVRCVLRHVVLTGRLPAFPQEVPAGDYIVIDVIDRGVGMETGVLQQAFDPFFTTKEVGQGTGLGLPVAFGIITGHQGHLTLSSETGQGTTVSIYLPRVVGMNEGAVSTLPDAAPTTAPPPPAVVLVVDDEEPVLDILRRFLELVGHTVHGVSSGKQAIEKLGEAIRPDLVILDWMIPKEDGATNLQQLRKRLPHIPIILCTGLVQPDFPETTNDPTVETLRKPFRMDDLWNLVNKLLSNSRRPV